jgi:hypothetical protein
VLSGPDRCNGPRRSQQEASAVAAVATAGFGVAASAGKAALLLLEPQQLHSPAAVATSGPTVSRIFCVAMLLSSLAAMSACIDAHCAFVLRANASRAVVGAKPVAGKTAACTATLLC